VATSTSTSSSSSSSSSISRSRRRRSSSSSGCCCWCVSDAETSQCVSTGSHDDIYKPENEALRNFLIDGGFMPSGIQLPAGTPQNNVCS